MHTLYSSPRVWGEPMARKEYILGLPRLSSINIDFWRFIFNQCANNPCVDGFLGEFALTQQKLVIVFIDGHDINLQATSVNTLTPPVCPHPARAKAKFARIGLIQDPLAAQFFKCAKQKKDANMNAQANFRFDGYVRIFLT